MPMEIWQLMRNTPAAQIWHIINRDLERSQHRMRGGAKTSPSAWAGMERRRDEAVMLRNKARQALMDLHRERTPALQPLAALAPPFELRSLGRSGDRLTWYVGLTDEHAEKIYHRQPKSNWCWAACFQMLFEHIGARPTIEAIVEQVLDSQEDQTIPCQQLEHHMNREWKDGHVCRFKARLDVYRTDHTDSLDSNALMLKVFENFAAGGMHLIGERMYHITVLRGLEISMSPRDRRPKVEAIHLLDPGRGPDVRLDLDEFDPAIGYIAGVQIQWLEGRPFD